MKVKTAVRLLSLCPSTTETLIDFGLAEQIVGITRFCIHPADVVSRLPRVGGTKDPNRSKIETARPDLIFMNEEENRFEDHAWLSERYEVDVSMPAHPRDVPPLLRRWGERLGVEPIAGRRAERIERILGSAPRTGPTFAYLIWREPLMAVGPGTYVHALLESAGLRNAISGRDRYPVITAEALAELAPDLVLLPDEPFPFDARHVPELAAALPARCQIRLVSGDDLSWHGVRTLRGLRLAKALAAGACSDPTTRWSADAVT